MNKISYLSKSDFKTALSCPVKLFYKKSGYPSLNDESTYLQLLAEGGFIVGEWAKLLYPDGIDIQTKDLERAGAETQELLKKENVVLFEPLLQAGKCLARIDVLVKEGSRIKLIEVKSKSADSEDFEGSNPFRGKRGGIDSKWKEYLQDATFQVMVARQAHPDWEVTPWLLVPDKSKTVTEDGLHHCFSISRSSTAGGREEVEVQHTATPEQVKKNNFLTHFNISEEVNELMPEVERVAQSLSAFIGSTLTKPPVQIGHGCKKCEFRIPGASNGPSGFMECWGKMGAQNPHLFDLYNVREKVTEPLIARGATGLYEIDPDDLTGASAERQQRQISCMQTNREWFSEEIPGLMRKVKYPLHFIDFEGTRMALPYHAGTACFNLVAFQWSCHTVESPGAEPIHREWLNTRDRYPNIEFARSLKEAVGEEGTLMVWSAYEKTALRDVADELAGRQNLSEEDRELLGWLFRLIENYDTRCIDLLKWTRQHYYHPAMKGSNSIKDVLPAVWKSNPQLHTIPWFAPYFAKENGNILDPYKTLEPMEIYNCAEVIDEGTGAMRAYEEMLYSASCADPSFKEAWSSLLKQYCKLDTLAMLIIWEHWRKRTGS